MQHFGFIMVTFYIRREVNEPQTVTMDQQAPGRGKERKNIKHNTEMGKRASAEKARLILSP